MTSRFRLRWRIFKLDWALWFVQARYAFWTAAEVALTWLFGRSRQD